METELQNILEAHSKYCWGIEASLRDLEFITEKKELGFAIEVQGEDTIGWE
jgi:hypothetical protein